MKRLFATIASVAVLGACWGAPPNESILSAQCEALFEGDARTMSRITNQAETTLTGFCDCFAAQAMKSPDLVDTYKDVLIAMNEAKEDGGDVEAAAERIEEMTRDRSITTFSEDDLEGLGDFFQDLSVDLATAGGTCPA
ncbi:MAG: hypothetical protein AAGJ68_03535 [Pseudomonadota bacterium]